MKADLAPDLIAKDRFIADIGAAVQANAGYAGGKIGFSEQHWLSYPIVLAATKEPRKIRAYETVLWHHFENQSGVYPSNPQLALEFVAQYAESVRQLDCLGLFGTSIEASIIRYHGLNCRFIRFHDMEPDRSTPADDAHCYLPHFRGLRLLLIAPFADLLRQRANQETFEKVWARTGKRWFHPADVAALDFPYAFDPETQSRYRTVLELRDSIIARIDHVDFDVALVAAGALGIPLAAHIKRSGRIAISLGGHLQVLFGVLGKRWRNRQSWHERYFNEHWIDMPERYRPKNWESRTDGGAYW